MRALRLVLIAVALAAPVAACRDNQPPPDQNVAITDNIPANADIETLPADESSATPSDELVNGADNADVNEANATGNSY